MKKIPDYYIAAYNHGYTYAATYDKGQITENGIKGQAMSFYPNPKKAAAFLNWKMKYDR